MGRGTQTKAALLTGMALYWPCFGGAFLPLGADGSSSGAAGVTVPFSDVLMLQTLFAVILGVVGGAALLRVGADSAVKIFRVLRAVALGSAAPLALDLVIIAVSPDQPWAASFVNSVVFAILTSTNAVALPMAWACVAARLDNACGNPAGCQPASAVPLSLSLLAASVLIGVAWVLGQAGCASGAWVVSVTPLVSSVVLTCVPRSLFREDAPLSEDPPQASGDSLGKLVAILILFALACVCYRAVFVHVLQSQESNQVTGFGTTTLIVLAAATAVAVAVKACRGCPSVQSYPWTAFILIGLAVLYAAAMCGSAIVPFCNELVTVMQFLTLFFLWVASELLAQREGRVAAATVGLVFIPICHLLSGFVYGSWDVASRFGELLLQHDLQLPVLLGLAFIITIVSFWYLSTRARKPVPEDAAAQNDAEALIEGSTPIDERALRRMACETLGARYGLTAREMDVLELLSKGHSQKRMAEALFLSLSSVQTYSKNIYRKMGIHSRQEVIDAVIAEMTTGVRET